MRKNEKITALYERLSRDDFGKDDTNSVRAIPYPIKGYLNRARQGLLTLSIFTDDVMALAVTCFDRPGFLAMMKEVEAGECEIYLCIKDMSRMGRDYLEALV